MKRSKNIKNVHMISKFASKCSRCGGKIKSGDQIWWNIDTKKAAHKTCFEKRGQGMGSRKGTERIDVRGIARQAGRSYRDVI